MARIPAFMPRIPCLFWREQLSGRTITAPFIQRLQGMARLISSDVRSRVDHDPLCPACVSHGVVSPLPCARSALPFGDSVRYDAPPDGDLHPVRAVRRPRRRPLFGIEVSAVAPVPAGSVNPNYRLETVPGEAVLARIYEGQAPQDPQ